MIMIGSRFIVTSLLLLHLEAFTDAAGLMKDVKKSEAILKGLKDTVEKLEANLTNIENEIKEHLGETRTGTKGEDEISIFDYYLSGSNTKCGPQQVTGWTKNVDVHYMAAITGMEEKCCQFNDGEFKAPVNGFYSICGWLRFKKGGNAVDITIRVDGTRKAAFGDAIQTDWRSTGTCFNYELKKDQKVTMWLESGGGSDCIENNGKRYGRFQGYLIAASP